jgi:hypothetical protein
MRKKSLLIITVLFFIFFFILFFYLKENIEKFNIQIEQNIERNLSKDWGSKEPRLFAVGYSADVSNLSLIFNKFIIEIPTHDKSHILDLTKRLYFDKCNFKINLILFLLDLHCKKLTTNHKNFIFDRNNEILFSKNFYFDNDIFQRLFNRFRFFDLKFYFDEVSINNVLTQNINGELEFHNDKNATLTIDDQFIKFFNRSEGLEIHYQNQIFFFLNQNFFQHFWN